ncbi:hypothetical protein [Sphingobium sp. MK2]|uniref:hypothetical protein n=1 Tax=Sphingobium sp. MK2 TaxID=3116540 RepID=UPI0032E358FE
MAALDFNNLFEAFSAGEEKVWKYDRTLSLGASEVFTCLRKNFFKKFGYEADDDHEQDWGAARRGDVIENNVAVPAVMGILKGTDAKLIYAGSDQETLKKGRLSATPDGLVIDADDDALAQLGIPSLLGTGEFVVEFKSFDPRSNIKEAKQVHVGQTQVQMGLMHDLTDYRPKFAVIIYFNASFLSDIRCYPVEYDPKVYAKAIERAKLVYATQEPTELMAEGKITGDCALCEFTEECAIAQGELMPKVKAKKLPADVLDRLAVLAERQRSLAEIEKTAKQDKKLVDEEIKEALRAANTKGAGDDRFSISMSWLNGKKSTDLLAMAADGIKIEDYQKEGAGFERLVVKIKEPVG